MSRSKLQNERAYQQGYDAGYEGRHVQTNPYHGDTRGMHWSNGHDAGTKERESREERQREGQAKAEEAEKLLALLREHLDLEITSGDAFSPREVKLLWRTTGETTVVLAKAPLY